jgi:hypothetical protein
MVLTREIIAIYTNHPFANAMIDVLAVLVYSFLE